MPMTSKPCPGCGFQAKGPSGRPTPFREAGSVCHECAEKLRTYDDLIPFEEGAVRFTVGKRGLINLDDDLNDALFHLFKTLRLPPMRTGRVGHGLRSIGTTGGNAESCVILSTGDTSAMFNRFLHALKAALLDQYSKGLKDGQNLLGQLNAGTLTMDQLDRKTRDAEGHAAGYRR